VLVRVRGLGCAVEGIFFVKVYQGLVRSGRLRTIHGEYERKGKMSGENKKISLPQGQKFDESWNLNVRASPAGLRTGRQTLLT
jgi:hypothetical protein